MGTGAVHMLCSWTSFIRRRGGVALGTGLPASQVCNVWAHASDYWAVAHAYPSGASCMAHPGSTDAWHQLHGTPCMAPITWHPMHGTNYMVPPAWHTLCSGRSSRTRPHLVAATNIGDDQDGSGARKHRHFLPHFPADVRVRSLVGKKCGPLLFILARVPHRQ